MNSILIEELGLDDAATEPDASALAEVDTPTELIRSLVDQIETLSDSDLV